MESVFPRSVILLYSTAASLSVAVLSEVHNQKIWNFSIADLLAAYLYLSL